MAQIFSAQQLLALPPSPPTTDIVSGLLRTRRKRPSLLCGYPGAGKSTLAHQLALAVATGTPFLGRNTVSGHVLFWKYEERAEDVREDLQAAGLTCDTKATFLLPAPGDDNFAELTKALKQHPETRLVIIETLTDFLRIEDICSNDDSRVAMQRFIEQIMTPHQDCAYLFLHHFGKGDLDGKLSITKVLGATALAGSTDAKIFLQQVSDGDPRRILSAQVRKGENIEPTYLDFHPGTLTAALGETVSSEKKAAKQAEKKDKELALSDEILAAVAANPGLPKWELAEKVSGNAQKIGKRIEELVQLGLITVKLGGEKGNAQLLYPTMVLTMPKLDLAAMSSLVGASPS